MGDFFPGAARLVMGYDKRIDLILLGDCGVGKTSILLRIARKQFIEEFEDIDQEQRELTVKDKKIVINMTDTAGQENFRTLTSSFYRNATAMIFVYDITDRETFESIEGHYRDATRYAQKAPSFLLGNKVDQDKSRTVATDEAQQLAQSLGFPYAEVSAKSGHGIEEALSSFADIILERLNEAAAEEEETDVHSSPSLRESSSGGAWKSIKRMFSKKK